MSYTPENMSATISNDTGYTLQINDIAIECSAFNLKDLFSKISYTGELGIVGDKGNIHEENRFKEDKIKEDFKMKNYDELLELYMTKKIEKIDEEQENKINKLFEQDEANKEIQKILKKYKIEDESGICTEETDIKIGEVLVETELLKEGLELFIKEIKTVLKLYTLSEDIKATLIAYGILTEQGILNI